MIELFRHNSWATIRLLEFCHDLDPALLDTGAAGPSGPVKETLAHVVGWEEALALAVEGTAPHEAPPRFASVDDLQERATRLAERWERSLDPQPHPERLVEFGVGGARRLVRVGTVLAQVVHHGNHHRAEVCIALRGIDIEPPALDAWAFSASSAETAGRRRRRDDSL